MKKASLLLVVLMIELITSWTISSADSPRSKFKQKHFGGQKDLQHKHQPDSNINLTKKLSQSPGVSVVQGAGNSIYDFQSNGGDCRHLWILPDGTVHAVYLGSENRESPHQTRRSYYAYSTDNGVSFTNLGSVESQTSEYPSMDITSDGRAVIASCTLSPYATRLYYDVSPGAGQFTKVDVSNTPYQCIGTHLAVPSDSLFVFFGFSPSHSEENTWNNYNPYTQKFGNSGPWGPSNEIIFPGVCFEPWSTIARSSNGKVAIILANSVHPFNGDFGENNIIMRESLDGGKSFNDPVIVTNNPADTTQAFPCFCWDISAVYVNEELHIVWSEILVQPESNWSFYYPDLQIKHWTAIVNNGVPTTAVAWDSVNFGISINDGFENGFNEGFQHYAIDRPHIGADEKGNLTIVFTGFSGDAANADPETGYAYGDIWAIASSDMGASWKGLVNLTKSPDMDDRYPYISPWNETDKINILYQSDTKAGSIADSGGELIGEVDHLFLKVDNPLVAENNDNFMVVDINGSGDFTSIQDGIDAAAEGDTVLVMPGTYFENINYKGKNICLIGNPDDPKSTIIDGSQPVDPDTASVVTFESQEDSGAVLKGFTITGGTGTAFVYSQGNVYLGGGIRCYDSSPTIERNIIRDNHAEGCGGILIMKSSNPTIKYNIIWRNMARESKYYFTGTGGGIGVAGASKPLILNNTIVDNDCMHNGGGGISVDLLGNPTLQNNIIYDNEGGGVFAHSATISYCNVFSNYFAWVLTDFEGVSRGEGCLSEDPMFVNADSGDFHLQESSPCIDAGDPNSPLDPNGSRCDIGAYINYGQAVDVGRIDVSVLAKKYGLHQNFPNPFNPTTTIEYSLPKESNVQLIIYNMLGQKMRTLVNEQRSVGIHSKNWDGLDNAGNVLSAGIYFYQLKADGFITTKKMILAK
jgi:parallel beta-helix repeat protein